MIEVEMNQNIKSYDTHIIGNLTLRKLLFWMGAIVLVVILNSIIGDSVENTTKAAILGIVALPLILMGGLKNDNESPEQKMLIFFRYIFFTPKRRMFVGGNNVADHQIARGSIKQKRTRNKKTNEYREYR